MNVLIDTNILLSAALRDRLPERVVLYVAGQEECKWLVTPEILAEYVEVLRRPKFALTAETLQRWAELLDLRTVNAGSPPVAVDFPRDPKDAPFQQRISDVSAYGPEPACRFAALWVKGPPGTTARLETEVPGDKLKSAQDALTSKVRSNAAGLRPARTH